MAGAPRVLLLPGIWMPGASMRPLARRLQSAGCATEIFSYAAVLGGPERVVPLLCDRLREFDAVVGHSLGGVMALAALRETGECGVRRVVCLGSPLAGSAAAAALGGRGATAWALGRSAALLQRGHAAWSGPVQVGSIAGRRAMGMGRVFAGFREPNDGSVAVAETRIPGLADHAVVDASHTGLVFSPQAAALAVRFLREGRFGEQ